MSATPVAGAGSEESLPLTGAAASGFVVAGLGLVGGGALLLMARRAAIHRSIPNASRGGWTGTPVLPA
ncbi:LPXTG cell wall anchor domain-containing protein [Actinoplanes regularis]|uniref:LPXTG cell wall anchor domain-containing protein n=1 Tax=Actinoplanes regularis TaxID=52697 RepID=UPI0025527924|nr:LPXTG cell wall anchor domain-containing protein [Actinoplanes regularis]